MNSISRLFTMIVTEVIISYVLYFLCIKHILGSSIDGDYQVLYTTTDYRKYGNSWIDFIKSIWLSMTSLNSTCHMSSSTISCVNQNVIQSLNRREEKMVEFCLILMLTLFSAERKQGVLRKPFKQ